MLYFLSNIWRRDMANNLSHISWTASNGTVCGNVILVPTKRCVSCFSRLLFIYLSKAPFSTHKLGALSGMHLAFTALLHSHLRPHPFKDKFKRCSLHPG